jgi:hypothetical protein
MAATVEIITDSEQVKSQPTVKPFGMVTLAELRAQSEANPCEYIVQDLIPESSVNLAVGDSGLGKTAWAYQLGLAVAGGVPFVGNPTKQGRVLYIDLENGRDQITELAQRLSGHLNLTVFPDDNFLLIPLDGDWVKLTKIVEQIRPSLVIIDTLRAFNPQAEQDNEGAATFLGGLRLLARKYKTAFILIHHVKKPGEHGSPTLEHSPVMSWLLEASGARALVNQTDVRIGFDAPRTESEIALIVKGHAKLRGEFGPVYLGRALDKDGEVTGYQRVSAVGLLGEQHQIDAYNMLPPEFNFGQARTAYKRTADPTDKFLKKCINLALLKKIARGHYHKIDPQGM